MMVLSLRACLNNAILYETGCIWRDFVHFFIVSIDLYKKRTILKFRRRKRGERFYVPVGTFDFDNFSTIDYFMYFSLSL